LTNNQQSLCIDRIIKSIRIGEIMGNTGTGPRNSSNDPYRDDGLLIPIQCVPVGLAEKIATDLMTCGGTDGKADRLKLYKGENYLSGWSYEALVSRINKHLAGEI
jgi:hypothetical protein